MNHNRPEIPNDDDNPFMDIGDLLEVEKISVATLATAIEKFGIYTCDQFGRFGLAAGVDKEKAFKLLEGYYEWESTPPHEKSSDPRSPIDQWGACPDNAYRLFGWATKVVPDFEQIRRSEIESQNEPKSSTESKHPGHLNHDKDLQRRANEIAAELKASKKRTPTKEEVAKIMVSEFEYPLETILRRIRAPWKKKLTPRPPKTL